MTWWWWLVQGGRDFESLKEFVESTLLLTSRDGRDDRF